VRVLASQPLTLDSAIRIALLNNRNLRAELLQLGVTRGQLVQASLFPNFEIEARGLVSKDGSDARLSEVGIGIDLTDLLLRGSEQGIAEAELEQARFRAAGATLDLGYQVRLACDESSSDPAPWASICLA
jgi:outer membrane protein, heavy metal efflux system